MKRIFVYLPCYNESSNIGALIGSWLKMKGRLGKLGYELNVICIDDKSTDNTAEIAEKWAEKGPAVRLIRHKVNKNLGGGVNTAFNTFLAEASAGDLCVLMDGDNTHDPKYILPMLGKIRRGADCVIASRYRKGSEVVGVPRNRLFLSDGARLFYTAVLGVKGVRDYTCGYRVYTYEILKKAKKRYKNDFVSMRTFSCMMEVLYKLSRVGAVFAEVPFVLRYDNKQGESKMRILRTVKDSIFTALKLRFSK